MNILHNSKMAELVRLDIQRVEPLCENILKGYEFICDENKNLGYLLQKPKGPKPSFNFSDQISSYNDRWDYEWYHNDLSFPFPVIRESNCLNFLLALKIGYGNLCQLNDVRNKLNPDSGMFGIVTFDIPDIDTDVNPLLKLRALSITEVSKRIIDSWCTGMLDPFCVYQFDCKKFS